MTKKKLLFFTTTLAAGGAEKVLLNTVRALKDEYDITVVVFLNRGVYVDDIKRLCGYEYIYNIKSKSKLVQRLGFSLLIRWQKLFSPSRLYKKYIKGGYDIEIAFLEGIPGRVLSGSNNNNKYAWIHTDLITNNRSIREYRTFGEEKLCNKKFKKVVGVSSDVTKKFIKKLGISKEKTATILNILDEAEIISKSKEPVSIEIDKKFFNIVAIGRLSKIKGYDRLINAVAQLTSQDKGSLRLNIIGDGHERANLVDMIKKFGLKDIVSLHGFMNNPYPTLTQSDLLVCSSYTEGLSTVAIEAIILGVPILSTDCSGMKDILGDSKYGMIVENSEAGILAGLKAMIEEKGVFAKYKKRALERGDFFRKDARVKEIKKIIDGEAR